MYLSFIRLYIYFCSISLPGYSVTTVAGVAGLVGATSTKLNSPRGISLDPTSRNLYIADYMNRNIRLLTQSSITAAANTGISPDMSIFASGSGMSCPYDITVDWNGNVYVTDQCKRVIFLITSSSVVRI